MAQQGPHCFEYKSILKYTINWRTQQSALQLTLIKVKTKNILSKLRINDLSEMTTYCVGVTFKVSICLIRKRR